MKQKVNWSLLVAELLVVSYLAYLFSWIYEPGMKMEQVADRVNYIMLHPFGKNYWNTYSIWFILISVSIVMIWFFLYTQFYKNYMIGKEYGSSDWLSAKALTKQLKDSNPSKNKIITENLRMSTNTQHTNLNNNLLGIGGSGSGKTFRLVIPNIYRMAGSIVVTDPKGELLLKCGEILKHAGYRIKVLNLVSMEKSDRYNPFVYIRKEEDVTKLINNLIANTTPKKSSSQDPFWEKAESLYLQSLFYYVWLEEPPERQNFNTLLDLLAKAEVTEEGNSELDRIMKKLEKYSPLGEEHPAVRSYWKCMRGAGDTIRSIIISANSRMAFFETKGVRRILSSDDMDFASIGIGWNGDGKQKTALFCVIPDVDKSYNFIVGMAYTQLFQELYYQADFMFDGELPIPVEFWLDEFPNVALPDDFMQLESTMRSRNISVNIFIQNMGQLKVLFEREKWETIVGNCDTLVYLGGNEQSSHKYISEELGKKTINKRSTSSSRGKMPSHGKNYDVLGRELLTPGEVRKLKRSHALVLISGFNPVYDQKYDTKHHILKNGKIKFSKYRHIPISEENQTGIEILNQDSITYYEKAAQAGEKVYMTTMTLKELLALPDEEDISILKEYQEMDQKETEGSLDKIEKQERIGQKWKKNRIEQKKLGKWKKKSILEILQEVEFASDQMEQIQKGLEELPEEMVKDYLNPELTAHQMEQKRLSLLKDWKLIQKIKQIEEVG